MLSQMAFDDKNTLLFFKNEGGSCTCKYANNTHHHFKMSNDFTYSEELRNRRSDVHFPDVRLALVKAFGRLIDLLLVEIRWEMRSKPTLTVTLDLEVNVVC